MKTTNRFFAALLGYKTVYGTKILNIRKHGSMHLHGRGDIFYVYPYHRLRDLKNAPPKEAKRIRLFWRFMDGDSRFFPYFYRIYLSAVRQVLWMTRTIGAFEIAAVPCADPDKRQPLEGVCFELSKKERFVLAKGLDASSLIARKCPIIPVHLGGRYSAFEMEKSLCLTRPLKANIIILLDDMVCSGGTIAACKNLLYKAGAKRVYAICLYGYHQDRVTER